MFDIQRSYIIDVKVLANKFKALQRLFHPDLFANRTEKEKMLSETWYFYSFVMHCYLKKYFVTHDKKKEFDM